MATLAPNSATLQRNQTQQFTVTGITSPVWTLQGIGTLTQSGLFTAPNVTGNALIRAHSSFWSSVDNTYWTKNADDTLTKNTSSAFYYGDTFRSNGALNAIGDYVEIVCVGSPYWLGVRDAGNYYVTITLTGISERAGGSITSGTITMPVAGDIMRFTILATGQIEVKRNGSVIYTTTNTTFTNRNLNLTDSAPYANGVVYKLPVFGGNGVTGYTEVTTSVSVQIFIDEFLSKDPLVQYVPNNNLQAWFAANKYISDGSGLTLPDLSMNSRHIAASASLPVIQNNKLNGLPALYWDGTKNPLTYTGNLSMRHLFIVCAYDGATFANYHGIISGAAEPILEGHSGQTKFYDNTYSLYGDFKFFRSFVSFPENNQQAKMSGGFAIYEIQYPVGLNLTGINIGQDRNISIGKWKGWFCEAMIYSEVLNEFLREQIYYYLALKYRVWRETSDGLKIFPFFSNKTTSMERNKTAYLSEAYNGNLKALVRGNYKRSYELPFALRPQAEFEAAEEFHAQHYPLQSFIFRDGRSYPAKNLIVRTNSSFKESGSDVTFRFNYSFGVTEL
ncbi:MAG TPA: hypothetical protein PKY59_05610 [Pyrinomonadaceae bacterium]|nr:hypothetical protein [Pyrinomonadaceae bacterium]